MPEPVLDPGFIRRPIAHRGLHGPDRVENSLPAIEAAISRGYGIEIDLQLSGDGVAMVFHDDTLERLTDKAGPLRHMTARALGELALEGGNGARIPSFRALLNQVAGRAPLLVELKDQDGALGTDIGALEADTAAALSGYDGPVAVMSFNPHSVLRMAQIAPNLPRGLTTCNFGHDHWGHVPPERAQALASIPDYRGAGACFISHQAADLSATRVSALRSAGAVILCWTIRNSQAEAAARRVAHNITFEHYLPDTLPPNDLGTGTGTGTGTDA